MTTRKTVAGWYIGDDAFNIASKKARYGHNDWLVWRNADGERVAARRSVASIERAMRDTGPDGKFNLICADTAIPMVVRQWLAENLLAYAKQAGRDGR